MSEESNAAQAAVEANGNPNRVQEAMHLLEFERQGRVAACLNDINAACEKHRCTLLPCVRIEGAQVSGEIRVVAR